MLPNEVQAIMAKLLFLVFAFTMLCVTKARAESPLDLNTATIVKIQVSSPSI